MIKFIERMDSTHGRLKLERLELLVSLHHHLGFREPSRRARDVLIERFLRFAREHLVDEHGFELVSVLLDRLCDSLQTGDSVENGKSRLGQLCGKRWAHSRQGGQELGILVLVRPFEVGDEIDGGFAGIDEVDDRRGMRGSLLRLELLSVGISSLLVIVPHAVTHLILGDRSVDPFARLGICRGQPAADVRLEPGRKVDIEGLAAQAS